MPSEARLDTPATPGARPRLPGTVWTLGVVSLLMDASSELVHALLPLFMSVTLGASMATIGWIEGVAEAIAQFARLASGTLSDRTNKRKPWLIAGYGLSAIVKPLFPLAGGIAPVAAARFLDRVGKGLRGAPRDALIADVTPPRLRGAAYGLRQALDSAGAVLGPLAAAGLLALYDDNIRAALWWAVLPAMLCVVSLMFLVREPERRITERKEHPSLRHAGTLPVAFWIVVAAATTLTLARFSEAFLLLRGASLGIPLAAAPIVFVVMNLVYGLSAYPAGALSDRIGRRGLLAAGIGVLFAADLALLMAQNLLALGAGIALWGLHMGLTQGLLAAMVADAAPPRLRGTAFGVFYAATGTAVLIASALAGMLWDRFGAPAPFLAGAIIATLALALLPLVGQANKPRSESVEG